VKAGVDRDVALDGAGRVLRCEKCRNVTSSVAQTCRVLPRSLGDLEGTLAPAQFDAKEMLPMSTIATDRPPVIRVGMPAPPYRGGLPAEQLSAVRRGLEGLAIRRAVRRPVGRSEFEPSVDPMRGHINRREKGPL
jgi:hypothetical protein